MVHQQSNGSILALDVGERRIGVALASTIAQIAHAHTTLDNDYDFTKKLSQIIADERVQELVVGLPRNMSGDETEQTRYVRDFIAKLRTQIQLPISFQDEAATSLKAEAELNSRGKPWRKSDVDALAATYILEDYIQEKRKAGV